MVLLLMSAAFRAGHLLGQARQSSAVGDIPDHRIRESFEL
jgi:hypothetical protein